jgi:hypothetical protein
VPLTDAEEAGIKLLDVLHKKKSPLNAYAMLMDWHLRDKGVRQEQQTLKDAGTAIFIGCAMLINHLAKHYNMTNNRPIEKGGKLAKF